MKKEIIEKWLKRIPKTERDVPYFVIDGELVTPNETIKALSENESIIIENPIDIDDLIVRQMKARLAGMPEDMKKNMKFLSDTKSYTVEETYNEVFNKTEYGIQLLGSYKKVYLDIISRLV